MQSRRGHDFVGLLCRSLFKLKAISHFIHWLVQFFTDLFKDILSEDQTFVTSLLVKAMLTPFLEQFTVRKKLTYSYQQEQQMSSKIDQKEKNHK